MSESEANRRVDDKGRVTIPQQIREQLDLEPGEEVRIAVQEGAIVVRPRISRSTFVETMRGCLSEETKAADAPSISADELKADWTSDLPNDR